VRKWILEIGGEKRVLQLPLKNRTEAGRLLADALQSYAGGSDVLVLALPRGGVPVAFEVAQKLKVPLDLILVRKLGVPGQKELAMGALASGGSKIMNQELVQSLHIPEATLQAVINEEKQELERRERAYRGNWPPPEVRDRRVILIDDGLATGATMRAAVSALRQQQPARIIVGIPVAPSSTVEKLRQEADEVFCLATPEPFFAISAWYVDFSQTSDDEVRDLLSLAWREKAQG
jgi:putative phosphoribosyl transferase